MGHFGAAGQDHDLASQHTCPGDHREEARAARVAVQVFQHAREIGYKANHERDHQHRIGTDIDGEQRPRDPRHLQHVRRDRDDPRRHDQCEVAGEEMLDGASKTLHGGAHSEADQEF